MDKKGDLTSTQIIMFIMAILGFLIVLVALFLVDIGGYSEEDICKLSVLTRATAPSAIQGAVPLKCKTKKICIREGFFGGCKDQFAGEENVEYVRLKGDAEEKRRIIEETSANAMYDCWSMMGQGKLDLFGDFYKELALDTAETTCVVCSRVAVDNDFVNGNTEIMNSTDINEYMRTHQIPGQGLTYLQAFTDRGVSSFASVKSDFNIEGYNNKIGEDVDYFSEESDRVEEKGGDLSGALSNQIAFVFMQIKSEEVEAVLINQLAAGGTAVGLAYSTPVGKVVGAVETVIGWIPGGKAVVAGVKVAAAVGVAGYGIYNAKQGQLAAFNSCGEFQTNDKDAKKGCSIVQGINYNFRDVNALCATIQGEL